MKITSAQRSTQHFFSVWSKSGKFSETAKIKISMPIKF